MHEDKPLQVVTQPRAEGTTPGLVVSGPDGSTFTPGGAMHLRCAWGELGVLNPAFSLGPTGRVMHIDGFHPTRMVLADPRNLGRWLLYEICAYMAAMLPEVTVLRFTLSRPLDGLGTTSEQVLTRLAALDRIGAERIGFASRSASMHVIEGLWRPTSQNLESLATALAERRTELRANPLQTVSETNTLSTVLRGSLDNVRRFLAG